MFQIVTILDLNISQGNVATLLRCGGIFNNDYCKFANESSVKFFLKIGQHLAKLQSIVACFFNSQYRVLLVVLLLYVVLGVFFVTSSNNRMTVCLEILKRSEIVWGKVRELTKIGQWLGKCVVAGNLH